MQTQANESWLRLGKVPFCTLARAASCGEPHACRWLRSTKGEAHVEGLRTPDFRSGLRVSAASHTIWARRLSMTGELVPRPPVDSLAARPCTENNIRDHSLTDSVLSLLIK